MRRAAAKLPLAADLEMLFDVNTRSRTFVPFKAGEADLPAASLPSSSKEALVIGARMLVFHQHTYISIGCAYMGHSRCQVASLHLGQLVVPHYAAPHSIRQL